MRLTDEPYAGSSACAPPRSAASPVQRCRRAPVGHGAAARGSRDGDGPPVGRRDPGRRPRLPDGSPGVERDRQDPRPGLPGVVPDEVAQPVGHHRVAGPSPAAEDVGVAAHHDVRPGVGEVTGEQSLRLRRAGLVLPAPVQVDHDELVARRRRLDRGDQLRGVAAPRRRRTDAPGARGPHVAGALALDAVGGEEGDLEVVDLDHVGVVRRLAAARADHRDATLPTGGQRVLQAGGAVVARVVVGHAHHVDAGVGQHVDGGRSGAEPVAVAGVLELLGVASSAPRHRRLQVDHGDVGGAQRAGDAPQPAGTVQQPTRVCPRSARRRRRPGSPARPGPVPSSRCCRRPGRPAARRRARARCRPTPPARRRRVPRGAEPVPPSPDCAGGAKRDRPDQRGMTEELRGHDEGPGRS